LEIKKIFLVPLTNEILQGLAMTVASPPFREAFPKIIARTQSEKLHSIPRTLQKIKNLLYPSSGKGGVITSKGNRIIFDSYNFHQQRLSSKSCRPEYLEGINFLLDVVYAFN